MPELKIADSAVLREKPIFSPRIASVSEWTLPRILKIKISRDTKQLFEDFSRTRPDFLSFLFLLTISRPGGYVKTKEPLHTLTNSRREKSSGISPDPESVVAIQFLCYLVPRNQRILHRPTGPL